MLINAIWGGREGPCLGLAQPARTMVASSGLAMLRGGLLHTMVMERGLPMGSSWVVLNGRISGRRARRGRHHNSLDLQPSCDW